MTATPDTPETSATTETTVPSVENLRAAENALTEAERSADAAALQSLLAEDFGGHNLYGRRNDRTAFVDSFTSADVRFESLETHTVDYRVDGTTGLVRGISEWRLNAGNRVIEGTSRFLDVWMWRRDRWQLVAAAITPRTSTSIVPPAPLP